jgi:hypothetical protein
MLRTIRFILGFILFSNVTFSQIVEKHTTNRLVQCDHFPFGAKEFSFLISFDSSKVINAKSIKKHKTLDLALDEAYFNAIIDNEIDVIVNPIYSIKKTKNFLFFGGNFEAQITGYAGFYKDAVLKDAQDKPCNMDIACLLEHLVEFAKTNKQEVVEEKEFKTIRVCNNCKEESEALNLMIVRTKKKSILDSYLETIK